jgi:phospholipid transport system substrate-binding protein
MKIKKFLIIFLFYFLSTNVAQSIQPDVFVQSTVNRASKVLSENISKDEKINELKKIALETVDIRGIGFYTLGSARKNLDDSQKQKYI